MESQFRQKELYKESILNQVKEIRASSDDIGCPYCGQPVKKSWEWCPACGHSLVDWCTFCGADIPRGEDECPECGMSRGGIVCPKCGTRNAGGFCRKCNEPLTLAAKKELERALKDPQFVKAAELAVQAAELLARIEMEDAPEEDVKKEIELPEDISGSRSCWGRLRFGRPGRLLSQSRHRPFDKLRDQTESKPSDWTENNNRHKDRRARRSCVLNIQRSRRSWTRL